MPTANTNLFEPGRAVDSTHSNPELTEFNGSIMIHAFEASDGELIVREAIENNRDSDPVGNIVIMHGLTQLSNTGPSAALQEILAKQHPSRRVLALETDGMGAFSEGLTLFNPKQIADYTLDAMIDKRVEFLQALADEGKPTTLVGTSMGSVLEMMVLREAVGRSDVQLNIDAVVLNDSAVVTKDRKKRMLAFLPHMLAATGIEFVLADNNKQRQRMLQLGFHALQGVGQKDGLAMGRQAYDLFFGDGHPTSDTQQKIMQYLEADGSDVIYLSGITDPLRRPQQYSKLHRQYPGTVHVQRVAITGHGRSLNPWKVASDISQQLSIYCPGSYPIEEAQTD